eukprot:6767850-Ditylum_brightwellii.AAC.1
MDEKKVDSVTHATFIAVKTISSSLFGEYEFGAHLAVEKGEQQFLKMKGGLMSALLFWFHRCLCVYAMARTNKTKKK